MSKRGREGDIEKEGEGRREKEGRAVKLLRSSETVNIEKEEE
jgi:hypothetical protein